MNEYIELTQADIEPFQNAINNLHPASNMVEYKGTAWDLRMAQMALEDLQSEGE